MARRRFFVDSIRNGQAELAGEHAKHLTRVLRVEPGQQYEISDNQSVWLAEIQSARKDRVIFRTVERIENRPAPVHTVLYAALIKFDRFEWLIEKATELGVSAITPFEARRSERGLEQAAAKRIDRWRRIALEASEQSRRDRLPVVEEPAAFDRVLAAAAGTRFALDESPGAAPLLASLPAERSASDRVALLLGPEGGWTAEERLSFANAGWLPVSLGSLVLRAETAAAAALAVITAAWQASGDR
jgi:16S rRNA (uracil1498-N3)-methyltransferase